MFRTLRSKVFTFGNQKLVSKRSFVLCNRLDLEQKARNDNKSVVLQSHCPAIEIPDMTFDQFLWKDVNKWSDKIAIVRPIFGNFLVF